MTSGAGHTGHGPVTKLMEIENTSVMNIVSQGRDIAPRKTVRRSVDFPADGFGRAESAGDGESLLT